MNFSERVPSNEWTALKHMGEEIAEAWFKPEGEPLTLVFRVPQNRFQVDDLSQQLTIEDLLKAAAISNEDVESWQLGDESHSGMDGTNPELTAPPAAAPAGRDPPHGLRPFETAGSGGRPHRKR